VVFAYACGHPFEGRLFCRDFLIAACQLPFSFSRLGSGPRNGLSGPRIGFFLAAWYDHFVQGKLPFQDFRKANIIYGGTGTKEKVPG